MLSLEIIKQSLENSANKDISPLLLKKTIESSIKNTMRIELGWNIENLIKDILQSDITEEEKTQLFHELKEKSYKDFEETKKEMEELFGSMTKEAE